MKTQITFNGIKLNLVGNFSNSEPETNDYPGYPATFEVLEIYLQDSNINILDLFPNEYLEDIENLAIETIN